MNLNTSNIATIIVACLAVIVALVGGVVVIAHPESLSFKQYVDALSTFVIGVGLLAVGRGLAAKKSRG